MHRTQLSGMAETVPQKLRKLLRRSGLSLQELAVASHYKGASSIQRYFSDSEYTREFLHPSVAHVFADALEGKGSPAITRAEVLELAGGPTSNVIAAPIAPGAPDALWPIDVPILGTAVGGTDGDFEINKGETLGYGRRPPWLTRRIFALYVQGTSMSRWREPGQLVYVDTARPPRPGDRVVVELRPDNGGDGHPALLKELVAQTATKLKLKQYNPETMVEVSLNRVIRVSRVIEWDELVAL